MFRFFGMILLGFERWFLRGTLLSITALVIALCRPYKMTYINVSDTLLLSHMATLCYILSSDTESEFFVPFVQILFLVPFIAFALIIMFRIICGLVHESGLLKLISHCLTHHKPSTVFNAKQRCRLTQPVTKYGATKESSC